MADFWMENAMQPGRHTLVDCGYAADRETEGRADILLAYVGRRNLIMVGSGRIVGRIPPRKVGAVLAAVPAIQAGAQGYCWCTHGFATPPASPSTGEPKA